MSGPNTSVIPDRRVSARSPVGSGRIVPSAGTDGRPCRAGPATPAVWAVERRPGRGTRRRLRQRRRRSSDAAVHHRVPPRPVRTRSSTGIRPRRVISFQPPMAIATPIGDDDPAAGRLVEGAVAVVGGDEEGQHAERQDHGDHRLRADLGLAGGDLLDELQVAGDVVGEGAQHGEDHVAAVLVGGVERLDHPVRHRVGEFGAGELEGGGDVERGGVAFVALPGRSQRQRARRGRAGTASGAACGRRRGWRARHGSPRARPHDVRRAPWRGAVGRTASGRGRSPRRVGRPATPYPWRRRSRTPRRASCRAP